MKKDKKEPQRNMKSIYTFRILGGAYLVYLSYSMFKGWADVPEKSKLFIGAFMVVFAIAGAALVIWSLVKYTRLKNEPVEINEIVDVENEVTENEAEVTEAGMIAENSNEVTEYNIDSEDNEKKE